MTIQQMIKQLAEAIARFRLQLPYLPRAFQLVHRAAGGLVVIWAALLLVQGLLPVASVYLTRTLVDGIAAMIGVGGGWRTLSPLLPAGFAMALVLIGLEVLQSIGTWVRTAQAERVQDHIHELIHEQAMRLDLSFYDVPGFYDQLHRARIDALSRPSALIENAGTLMQSFITLAAMGGVLLTFGIWIPLLLAFSTLPALLVVLRHTIRFHRWRIQNTTAIRKTSYYDLMLTQRDAAAEMRLFGLGPHFRALFRNLRKRLRREKVQLARSEAAAQAAAALIGLASMACASFASSFSKVGSPSPTGTLRIMQDTTPPTESPCSLSSATSCSIFTAASRSGQRMAVKSTVSLLMIVLSTGVESISPMLLTQAMMSILHFSFRIFAAMAPAATVPMVSLALDRPPPDDARMPYFIW